MRNLWEGGVFRMVYAGAGFVQNERGDWVRPENVPQPSAVCHAGPPAMVTPNADAEAGAFSSQT